MAEAKVKQSHRDAAIQALAVALKQDAPAGVHIIAQALADAEQRGVESAKAEAQAAGSAGLEYMIEALLPYAQSENEEDLTPREIADRCALVMSKFEPASETSDGLTEETVARARGFLAEALALGLPHLAEQNVEFAMTELRKVKPPTGAQAAGTGWVSVKERLPEQGQMVWFGNYYDARYGRFLEGKFWRWTGTYPASQREVTHWQPAPMLPLPPPPAQEPSK